MNPQNHIGKLILLLCLALPVAAHAQTTPEEYYKSGNATIEKRDWEGGRL